MIDINIVSIEEMDRLKYNTCLSLLPENLVEEIVKYRLKEDRYRRIAGKIILLNYLKKYTNFNLSNIKKTPHNRPYIEDFNIDFSISYSKNYAVCAFAKNFSIGIDIEALNLNINIEEFKEVFKSSEFNLIQNSEDKIDLFYRLWTIKEAVLKADGRGFNCNPKNIDIDIENKKATLQDKVYSLHFIKLDHYICTLAIYPQNKYIGHIVQVQESKI